MEKKRVVRRGIVIATLVGGAVYLNNASWLADPIADRPFLVAHRGMAQGFALEGLTGQTCTAARMIPVGHDHLENTLPSMAGAFAVGADFVELDLQRTRDDRFVVFHDWTLECRTEGNGITGDHTLAELQQLDVGYGYTSDGGATYPFRGKGVGMMPTLEQVLETFPDGRFVLDVKSNEADDGRLLALFLAELGPEQRARLAVYGGPKAIAEINDLLPELRSITRPRLKRCLKHYIAWGWSGYVPAACENALLTVPANIAPWLWGWPNRFLRRMDAVGTRVALLGDYHGESFSIAYDDPKRAAELPDDYSGGIWTDRIELIAPVVLRRER